MERNELKYELENMGEFSIKNLLNPGRNIIPFMLQNLGSTGLHKRI